MKDHFKLLGWTVAAEILSLFIALTLASELAVMRVVCAVCTVGILLSLMAQGGHSAAVADHRAHRETGVLRPIALGITAVLPHLLLWGMLMAARCEILPDDSYRLYKLLDAPFLPVCTLLSTGVSTASVPTAGLFVLLALSLLPFPAVVIAYCRTKKARAMT